MGHIFPLFFMVTETFHAQTFIKLFLRCVSVCAFFQQFKMEMLDTLYRFAKFQFECGNYSGSAEYLYIIRVLVSTEV